MREGEEEDFCCVVVGNKVDVGGPSKNGVVGEVAVLDGDVSGGGNEQGKMKSTVASASASRRRRASPATPSGMPSR